jgi:hypothetical protein
MGTMTTAAAAGWWHVKWDESGNVNSYRVGSDGCYDLKVMVGLPRLAVVGLSPSKMAAAGNGRLLPACPDL